MGGTIIYFKQLGIHKNKTTVSLTRLKRSRSQKGKTLPEIEEKRRTKEPKGCRRGRISVRN